MARASEPHLDLGRLSKLNGKQALNGRFRVWCDDEPDAIIVWMTEGVPLVSFLNFKWTETNKDIFRSHAQNSF